MQVARFVVVLGLGVAFLFVPTEQASLAYGCHEQTIQMLDGRLVRQVKPMPMSAESVNSVVEMMREEIEELEWARRECPELFQAWGGEALLQKNRQWLAQPGQPGQPAQPAQPQQPARPPAQPVQQPAQPQPPAQPAQTGQPAAQQPAANPADDRALLLALWGPIRGGGDVPSELVSPQEMTRGEEVMVVTSGRFQAWLAEDTEMGPYAGAAIGRAAYYATLRGRDGKPLFPSLANNRVMQVITRLGATAAGGDLNALVALSRLIDLLARQDAALLPAAGRQ